MLGVVSVAGGAGAELLGSAHPAAARALVPQVQRLGGGGGWCHPGTRRRTACAPQGRACEYTVTAL